MPKVRNAPLLSDHVAIRVGYPRVNIKLNQHKQWNAGRKQTSIEQLFHLNIKRVCLVNIWFVRIAIAANQQSATQVPSILCCKYFCLAKYLVVFFTDVPAHYLFAVQTTKTHPPIIVEDLQEGKERDYTEVVLMQDHRCTNVIAATCDLLLVLKLYKV